MTAMFTRIFIQTVAYLLILSSLLLVACEDPLAEQDFFTVNTESSTTTADAPLGRLLLSGVAFYEESFGAPTDHGFYFSEDLSAVDEAREGARCCALGPLELGQENRLFTSLSDIMEKGKTYYYTSYLSQGGRLVTGRILQFTMNAEVTVQPTAPRRNDTMDFRLTQLNFDGWVADSIGYYLVSINEAEEVDTLSGPVRVDGPSYDFSVAFPAFNTRYQIVPFFSGAATYLGEPLPVLVTDGWDVMKPYPTSVNSAAAISNDDRNTAFILFGLNGGTVCDSSFFLTDSEGQSLLEAEWQLLNTDGLIANHSGIVYEKNNALYYGLGLDYNGFGYYAVRRFYPSIDRPSNVGPQTLSNAIVVESAESIYVGTGDLFSASPRRETDAFFRLTNPNGQVINLDSVASLPLRLAGTDDNIMGNRVGGVAFSAGGVQYAGLGLDEPTYLNDMYRLQPSGDDQLGEWEFTARFPGGPRTEAISFTIGEDRAFVGTGATVGDLFLNDLWEWKATTNTWQQRQSIPSLGITQAVAFTLGEYGCVCTGRERPLTMGQGMPRSTRKCWRYTPSNFD